MALIPFLITTGVIISAFAQMFYIGSKNSSYCDAVIAIPEKEWLCNTSNQYGTIYGTLYAMLFEGEVECERDSPLTTGLSYSFGFIIGLLFLKAIPLVLEWISISFHIECCEVEVDRWLVLLSEGVLGYFLVIELFQRHSLLNSVNFFLIQHF